MTTAVDTNILLDILLADKNYFIDSKSVIDTCLEQGQLIISEVVYAELACQFTSDIELKEFLVDTSLKLVHSGEHVLCLAGARWKGYSKRRKDKLQCSNCGKSVRIYCENCNAIISSRQRMVSDFMIGAHALINADLLLSRDRGFYKTYFKDVEVKYKT